MKTDTIEAIDLIIDSIARQSVTYISPAERKALKNKFEEQLSAKQLDFADPEIIENITVEFIENKKKTQGDDYFQYSDTPENIAKMVQVADSADDHLETGQPSSYNPLNELIFFYDLNNNSALDYSELLTANYSARIAGAEFLTADRNKDGALSASEIATANDLAQKIGQPLFFSHETRLTKDEVSFYTTLYDDYTDITTKKIGDYSLANLGNMSGIDSVEYLIFEGIIDFTYAKGTDMVGQSVVDVDPTPLMHALSLLLENDPAFRKSFNAAIQKGYRFHFRNSTHSPQGTLVNGNIIDLQIPRSAENMQTDIKTAFNHLEELPPAPVSQSTAVQAILQHDTLSGQEFLNQMEKVGAFSFTGSHADKMRKDFITIYDGSPFMREGMRKGIANNPERKYHFSSHDEFEGGMVSTIFDDFEKVDVSTKGYISTQSADRMNNLNIFAHELAHATMGVNDVPAIDFIETIVTEELDTRFKGVTFSPGIINYDQEKASSFLIANQALDKSAFIDYILAPETDINSKTASNILDDIEGFTELSNGNVTHQNYNDYINVMSEIIFSRTEQENRTFSLPMEVIAPFFKALTAFHVASGIHDPDTITSILLSDLASTLEKNDPRYALFEDLIAQDAGYSLFEELTATALNTLAVEDTSSSETPLHQHEDAVFSENAGSRIGSGARARLLHYLLPER